MPNNKRNNIRGGGGGYVKGGAYGHDDRTMGHDYKRVSFKNNQITRRQRRENRQQGWDQKIRQLLQDNDIDMASSNSRNDRHEIRYQSLSSIAAIRANALFKQFIHNNPHHPGGRRNRGGGSGSSGGQYRKRFLQESPTHWYKVMIRYGNRFEKDYLIKRIAEYLKPAPFIPLCYKVSKEESSFFIDDHATAEELQNARIPTVDGRMLMFKVRPFTPIFDVDPKITDTLKKVMASRYIPFQKLLDLTKLHADPMFLAENILFPLNRNNVMVCAIELITDSIPDLVALNLSDNKLVSLESMKIIIEKLPNLKSLSFSNNKLREIRSLDCLKGLALEEINLDGNPFCSKFPNQDDYVRAICQRFPKIIKLDGITLPPPILFDTGEDEAKLPSSKPSFMCDPERGMVIARTFLEHYYQIYDSDDRTTLIQAYHDEASFSMDCYWSGDHCPQLSFYLLDSRNLLRIHHSDKRVRQLKKGKGAVVNFLKGIPKTQHDPASFMVDLVLFTPELIQLNVCGLFKERDETVNNQIKFFSRTFIIIPAGTGFCIVNEQLTFCPASAEQLRKVQKAKEIAQQASALPAVTSVPDALPVNPAVVAAAQSDIVAKQQMVTRLAEKTGMNLPWSEKCLNETNWNFDVALYSFGELQKTGSIPQEAFQK